MGMKKLLLAATFAALIGGALRLNADQGTTAAAFLKLATGPRVIAMGENFTGLADDANAVRYNAAGTAYLDESQATLMHAIWIEDIYYDDLAAAFPMKNIGTIGTEIFYLNAGNFDAYNAAGVSTGQFSAGAMSATLSFARKIIDSVSVGLAAKYLSENIDGQSSTGFAVDLSTLYKTPIKGLTAGMNVANLGPAMGYSQAFTLPVNVRFGAAYSAAKDINVVCDYTQPIETAGVFGIGGEYGYKDFLVVRGGFKFQGGFDYNQVEEGYGPSAAAGLTLGMGLKYGKYGFDYAYAPQGFLGDTHRFALNFKF